MDKERVAHEMVKVSEDLIKAEEIRTGADGGGGEEEDVKLNEAIKAGTGKSPSPSRKRFRSGILVTQLALTVPLVLSCIVGFSATHSS